MTQEKIKTAIQTWLTPSLVVALMYFVKTNYEEIRDNQKLMMQVIPVMQEKQSQIERRVSVLESIQFSDNMNQKEKSPASSTKVVFLKPDDIKLPKQ